VYFDVDSTGGLDEGIDELAELFGAGKAIAEWTSRLDVPHSLELLQLIWC
jgi:phosphoserine phosphatase